MYVDVVAVDERLLIIELWIKISVNNLKVIDIRPFFMRFINFYNITKIFLNI